MVNQKKICVLKISQKGLNHHIKRINTIQQRMLNKQLMRGSDLTIILKQLEDKNETEILGISKPIHKQCNLNNVIRH